MADRNPPARPPSYDKKIGLVLQGGGALGSYQAGAYEALASSEYLPDWVAGISIGAINAAIIAGNCAGEARRASAQLLGGNHRSHCVVALRSERTVRQLATEGKRAFSSGAWPTRLFCSPRL